MSRKIEPAEMPLTKAILDGPILSSRSGPRTTTWRDGEVVREDQWGRVWSLPSVDPVKVAKAVPAKEAA